MAMSESYPLNSDVISIRQLETLEKIPSSIDLISRIDSISNEKTFKHLIRSTFWPINHPIRHDLWMKISNINPTHSSLTTEINSNLIQWPKFIDKTNLCFYYLTETKGQIILKNLLSTFAYQHPDITYCPTIEPIAALLLHYHHENDVLTMINRLFTKNWLCGGTVLQWEANCQIFPKLLRMFYKSAADFIDRHFDDTKTFYNDWFWWIFRDLPFSYLIKILDCLLVEGSKCLFRISLTLVHLFTKQIKSEPNGSIQNLSDYCRQIPISNETLLNKSFRIRNFQQKTIDKLLKHEEIYLRQTHRQLTTTDSTLINCQHLLTTIPEKSILNHEQFFILWNWLPNRLTLYQPILVFTTDQHGFRLQSLLNKIDELEYSILIVKTTTGEIFGGFCAGLWSQRHQRAYFGFGETFLFTLTPTSMKYSWIGKQTKEKNRDLFLFVDQEKLIIGGGNGDGLYIDQSLCQGHTNHCETFNNPPLCSQIEFSIAVLEMLAFENMY